MGTAVTRTDSIEGGGRSADRPDGMVMLGAAVIEGRLLESKFEPALAKPVVLGKPVAPGR
jgi:hypothetical protein